MHDERLNLRELPELSQRQDSVTDQLLDLKCVAARLGMGDAADFIQRHLEACAANQRQMNTHPFVATESKNWCSSCGKHRSDPIHRS